MPPRLLPPHTGADVKSTLWPGWLPRSGSFEGCVEFSPIAGALRRPQRDQERRRLICQGPPEAQSDLPEENSRQNKCLSSLFCF